MIRFDLAYGIGLLVASPWWLLRAGPRKKVRDAWTLRRGQDLTAKPPAGRWIMIHAVSLGEINATPRLVQMLLEADAALRVLITATTLTGHDRALQLYGNQPRVAIQRFPLDLTGPIRRLLAVYRPAVVALMELEVWPNFASECRRQHIPLVVINGRLTTDSFRGYRWLRPIVGSMFASLSRVCVQDQTYAERFAQVGAQRDRIAITGTMKFDGVDVADRVEPDPELAAALGIDLGKEQVWVCASTGPGEEAIALETYRTLRAAHPRLRLVIVPRKPERFEEVAQLIRLAGFELVRRSNGSEAPSSEAVILGDTMGEMRRFYSLATVVFVGRTLVDLGPRQHGSDMIEPAALGKPVVLGSYTGNFAEAMKQFRAAGAMLEVASATALASAVDQLLGDETLRQSLAERAKAVVASSQGATRRHADVLLELGAFDIRKRRSSIA